jgi:hypothetical protein
MRGLAYFQHTRNGQLSCKILHMCAFQSLLQSGSSLKLPTGQFLNGQPGSRPDGTTKTATKVAFLLDRKGEKFTPSKITEAGKPSLSYEYFAKENGTT